MSQDPKVTPISLKNLETIKRINGGAFSPSCGYSTMQTVKLGKKRNAPLRIIESEHEKEFDLTSS